MGIRKKIILRIKLFVALLFLFVYDGFSQHDSSVSHRKVQKFATHIGTASYYSNKFIGRKTASGEIFSQNKMTAACNIYPLGSKLKVIHLNNHKSVIVKVNDRLHAKNKRLIDLTTTAAKKLNFTDKGLAKVKIERIDR